MSNGRNGQLEGLQEINNTLGTLSGQIDDINRAFIPPPDDQKPTYLALLASMKTRAQHIIDVADEIIEQVG
jgi:hypothetical protein